MSTLPPRRNLTPTRSFRQHATPLQVLLQMGFSKQRAEKALAATGYHSVQSASDWLLAHVNDPTIDEVQPREYILYACPTGLFMDDLKQFFDKTLLLCGWNGAQNYIPHVTLVSFFKAPDECALQLADTLKEVMDKHDATIKEPLKLETYTSQDFMGFFVAEEHADILKRIAMQYVKDVSNAIINDTYEQLDALTACFPWCTATTARCIPRGNKSIILEPHVKSLNMSLAYAFPQQSFSLLKHLVEELNPRMSAEWELRLYSRDTGLLGGKNKQVNKVIVEYQPRAPDELELRLGDLIYLDTEQVNCVKNASEKTNATSDGWIEGVSWLTGQRGFLPLSYTQRTAESDAWTLHKQVPLCVYNKDTFKSVETTRVPASVVIDKNDVLEDSSDENSMTYADESGTNDDDDESNLKEIKNGAQNEETNGGATPISSENARKLFIMRHGERIDFTFGSWIPYCFDEDGNYNRKDLNMPMDVPKRKNGPKGFMKDTPLTNAGIFQARLTGEGLKSENVVFMVAYSSPSLRSIQTCSAVLEGMDLKDKVKICIEPGLFEWTTWYTDSLPDFLTIDELLTSGFNVDPAYCPKYSIDDLDRNRRESFEDFYSRSHQVTLHCLQHSKNGDILLVGHATTLDACTRQLVSNVARDECDIGKLLMSIPYCSLVVAQQRTQDKWDLIKAPCPPITISNNSRFNWRILF